MNIPYNTGKVLIGCNYTPPKYVEEDSDMLLLQSYLIYCPRMVKRYIWERRILKVCTISAFLLMLFGLLTV
jgi:hypothetical protein